MIKRNSTRSGKKWKGKVQPLGREKPHEMQGKWESKLSPKVRYVLGNFKSRQVKNKEGEKVGGENEQMRMMKRETKKKKNRHDIIPGNKNQRNGSKNGNSKSKKTVLS